MTVLAHRRWHAVLLLLSVCGAMLLAPRPAAAAPSSDPDGGVAALQAKLRAAAAGYTAAAAKLNASRQRQAAVMTQVKAADARVAELTDEVNQIAGLAYRTGGLTSLMVLLDSGSPDEFLNRGMALDTKLRADDGRLRDLRDAKRELARARAAADAEVATQQTQLTEMAKRKKDAETALANARGSSGPGLTVGAASAAPAPRNPDGTWPPESCSVKDPTSSGCLTPRTYHAYQQVRAAGFTHYVACWRSGSSGEHPLGRACDWAAAASGFGGVAYGADKAYGDRLASWLIANTDRLGVLYVIWYHQIWMPGIGWRYYTGDGTPAGDHMNHVHMSIQ